MIDLFSIIFQFFIFIFFSIMPFGIGIKYSYKNFKNLNFFETASINLLFLILILFLFSFLSFNLKIVYLSIIFIYALLGIFFIQDIIKYLKNNFFNYKFLSFLIIFLVISIDISRNPILGWDGLHIWVEKANLFYEGNNFLQVKENSVMKQYPHLGTYLWAFFWKNSIANYEYLGRLFYIFLYLLTIFVFLSSLKNINKVVFLIIVLFVLFSSYDTGLGGYQTYLIYSLSTLYLYLTFNNRTNNLLLFFAYLSLFLLSWIKNEGAIYSMMLLLTFLFVNKFDKKILIHSAILTLLILIQFIVNKFFFNSHDTFQFNINIELASSFFENFFYKFFILINYFLKYCLKYPIWLIILVFNILNIYNKKNINDKKYFNFLVIFQILFFAFIFVVYMITPFGAEAHIQTSLERLMIQVSGILFFGNLTLLYHTLK